MTDFAAISEALAQRAEDVCRRLLPDGMLRGHTWVCGDVHGTKGDSMAVHLDGTLKGHFFDFASGDKGDLLDLIQMNRGMKPVEAADWARDFLGLPAFKPNGNGHVTVFDPLKFGFPTDDGVLYGSAAWTYRDASGEPIGWVVRFPRPDGKKDIRPIRVIDGKHRWKGWTGSELRPLYNLHLLAKRPSLPVLIVEGEKTADAAAKLFPSHVCVTWMGGTSNIAKADWTELLTGDRPIMVWPDADKPGRDAATYIKSRCPRAKVVRTDDLPDGWDLADPVPEGVSIAGLLDGAGVPVSNTPIIETPFRLLGFSNDEFFYLSVASGIVVSLSAASHTDLNLQRIAPDDFWKENFMGRESTDYKAAAKWLIAAQHRAGFFDPSKLRGVGCWLEGATVVFHAGDRLYINGQSVPLHAHQSQFIYPRRAAIAVDLSQPASVTDGQRLSELCSMLPWKQPERGWMLSGWLMCAMVCGALPWRPHLWIYGGSGSGKSWTFSEIVTLILGNLALYGQSSTTEAGLRQTNGCDAKPFALDEMESKDDSSLRRMRGVCELSRQASSETGAPILKGSASGESVHYRCRSSFLFHSIAVGATEQADENRISRLELVKSGNEASFEAIKAFWSTCIGQDGFCDRIRARAITMAPMIRASYEIFRAAIARAAGSSRAGQQMGAIAAGYWCLLHDDLPTKLEAEFWVERQNWKETDSSPDSDENRVLDILLQTKITIESDNNLRKTVAIAEALHMVYNTSVDDPGSITLAECAKDALDRHGIRPVGNLIHIANRHVELYKFFKGSQFDGKWAQYLERIPGAEKSKFRSKSLEKSFWSVAIHVDVVGVKRQQPDLAGTETP